MTVAVVVLGAGGSAVPSGDASVLGLTGAEADVTVEITPLGGSLAGALLLSYSFLRSSSRGHCGRRAAWPRRPNSSPPAPAAPGSRERPGDRSASRWGEGPPPPPPAPPRRPRGGR
ncbi:hypothetical protein GCM10010421_55160 [Streptomyces glaucus]|uniref:Secreted protein n=1 Tax=Streptomyces glaucus TaxID=284029 RepID=A0ABN3KF32_9ACTN